MATKVSLGPEVKQTIESCFGVKIDGVITLADILAVVSALIKVLKMPDVKALIAEALDGLVKRIKATPSKIDDVIVGGAVTILKKALGI
jgi:hypothetical protein